MKDLPTNCERVGAWLDAGRPESVATAANAHAAGCERCREALAADRALDAAVRVDGTPAAPRGFTDRVLHAVDLANEARAHAPVSWMDAMPWWSRAAMQPPVLGAAALAALLVWRPAAIEQAARVVLANAMSSVPSVESWLAQSMGAASPGAQLFVACNVALLLLLAALPLYRWTERVARRGV